MELPRSDAQIIEFAVDKYAADKGNSWFKRDVDINKSSYDKDNNIVYLRDQTNKEISIFYIDSGKILSEDEWNNIKSNYGHKQVAKQELDRIPKETDEARLELKSILKAKDEIKQESDRILLKKESSKQELDRILKDIDEARLELKSILKAKDESKQEFDRILLKIESAKQESDRTLKVNREIAKRNQQLAFIEVSHSYIVKEESIGLNKFFGGGWRTKKNSVKTKVYRESLTDAVAITMVQIPAGSFHMGSPLTEAESKLHEGPQHRVQLQSFFLGQTPVTQAQWQEVASWPQVDLKLNPNPAFIQGANRPVEMVTWVEAMEFCCRLSQRTMLPYTLPSEAQWEYACRAATTSPFAFGETLTPDLANYDGNSSYGSGPEGEFREKTTEVGIFAANAWGLQDMHGNVFEWCLDCWHDDYRGAPSDGIAWVHGGKSGFKLLRGGSWDVNPGSCRSAFRYSSDEYTRDNNAGFRLCLSPPGLIS